MTDEFKTFEEYAEVVKSSLEALLHDDSMAKEDQVQVIYATYPVAFAKFSQATLNGQKPGPLVSFFLSGIEIDHSQQLGGWKRLNVSTGYSMRAPVIAKLTYRITINAIKESQGNLLQAQLFMGMPFNRPYATKLNGQWVTMTVEEADIDDDDVEIESDDDIQVKKELDLVVDRAYFEHPIQVNNNYIKEVNIHLYSVDSGKGEIDESN